MGGHVVVAPFVEVKSASVTLNAFNRVREWKLVVITPR